MIPRGAWVRCFAARPKQAARMPMMEKALVAAGLARSIYGQWKFQRLLSGMAFARLRVGAAGPGESENDCSGGAQHI